MDWLEKLNFCLKKNIEDFKKELFFLRTNRISSTLLENLLVECYGSKMSLVQLAHISIKDSRTLLVEAYDKSVVKEIEKAIFLSPLGFSCRVQDNSIYVSLPLLTEEKRKELVKILHQKKEETRVKIRISRDEIWHKTCQSEKEHQISEDEKFIRKDELQKKIDEANKKIDEISEKKEGEIMTV